MLGAMASKRFTELVGCELPIQLAGMGGVGTIELAAAVAHAGGLGMVPISLVRDDQSLLRSARQMQAAIGVNVLMVFLERDIVERVAPDARVLEFFYDDPDPVLVEIAHAAGALACWQVGSPDEARQAVDAGCDLVVAQGVEAGGHVRGVTPLVELLPEVRGAVDVPVVAAGGISTRPAVQRAMEAGADAVRVGTRFVVANESGAHPEYAAALCTAEGDATVLTTSFGVFWPDAPHRVLRSAIDVASGLAPDAPVATLGDMDIPRWASLPPSEGVDGRIDAMALYAGTGVGDVTRRQSAAEIVRDLMG
jgi:nitronate monooxygenase